MSNGFTAGERLNLGKRVKEARLLRRLSIDKAAEASGMSPVTWTRVENGDTVLELTYSAVAGLFGWTADRMRELASTEGVEADVSVDEVHARIIATFDAIPDDLKAAAEAMLRGLLDNGD